jgi:hypothetical protein
MGKSFWPMTLTESDIGVVAVVRPLTFSTTGRRTANATLTKLPDHAKEIFFSVCDPAMD